MWSFLLSFSYVCGILITGRDKGLDPCQSPVGEHQQHCQTHVSSSIWTRHTSLLSMRPRLRFMKQQSLSAWSRSVRISLEQVDSRTSSLISNFRTWFFSYVFSGYHVKILLQSPMQRSPVTVSLFMLAFLMLQCASSVPRAWDCSVELVPMPIFPPLWGTSCCCCPTLFNSEDETWLINLCRTLFSSTYFPLAIMQQLECAPAGGCCTSPRTEPVCLRAIRWRSSRFRAFRVSRQMGHASPHRKWIVQ